MNLCRDCAHYRHGNRFGGPFCWHPALVSAMHPVHGFRQPASPKDERADTGRCGSVGAYFEPSAPRLPRPPKKRGFLARWFA